MVFLYSQIMENIDKIKQRNIMLEKRRLQSIEQQRKKSQLIVKQIKGKRIYKEASTIAYYHAVRGEADPKELSHNFSKRFYLPIISEKNHSDHKGLVFAPATKDTQYKNNQFGIPEPICDSESYFPVKDLDIVLMPLLGFDLQASRLGMGGGYYDRCFSFKKKTKNTDRRPPLLIGYAFDFQEIQSIQAEPWDIALDGIVTESRFIMF